MGISGWVCPTNWGKHKGIVLSIFLQFVLFIVAISPVEAQSADMLKGIVMDENRVPVEGAVISVWLNNKPVASSRTGSDGCFELKVEAEALYDVYVFADDDSTPGVDYLPSRVEVAPSEGGYLSFTLSSAASLVFEGDIQFVESETPPSSIAYLVLDPESNEVIELGGFPLIYGHASGSRSAFLGLDPSHLVVPAGVPFFVLVNSSVISRSDVATHCFKIDELDHFMLERGQLANVDVTRYSLPFNLGFLEALQEKVDSRMRDMELLGFYLTTERGTVMSAVRGLSEARCLYDKGMYIESFEAAKRGFIALIQTQTKLENLYRDAALSVYTLILFFTFVSIAISFLLLRGRSAKLFGSVIVSSAMLSILYFTYPGSNIISPLLFCGSSAMALSVSLIMADVLPLLMRGRGSNFHLPVRNIIIPIFSMAKRGISRRRLRFALTMASTTVLVMSFVALTSFSEGYGLVIRRVSKVGTNVNGVLLRAPGFNKEEPTFIKPIDIESGWLERQPESRVISPKAENLPVTQPVATLNGAPIFGILGIDSTIESAIMDFDAILKQGRLHSDGGIMISDTLRDKLGVDVGYSLLLSGLEDTSVWVRLQGVFEDDVFRQLRDLDGSTYLPGKMMDATPEGPPTFIYKLCEPCEVVVSDLSTALMMSLVGITRVGITVEEGVDVNAFAKRLALERGYLTWSASENGVLLTRLGGYFEGKGLPLIVPWGIIVLNVVVTMLNSMYERRKEIHILSSVGLNPAQIAAIFFAEASIIGLTAGGLGYIAGLSLYRVMTFLGIALEVHQKVSALWSLASIGLAMTAVLIGALIALKNSVIITPSLMRRWKIHKKREDFTDPFELVVPIKLLPEDLEGFIDFVVQSLKTLEADPVKRTSSIRVSDDAEAGIKRVDFVYKAARSLDASNFYTENTVLLERRQGEEIGVMLRSDGTQKNAQAAGILVRMIAMDWSTAQGKPMNPLKSE